MTRMFPRIALVIGTPGLPVSGCACHPNTDTTKGDSPIPRPHSVAQRGGMMQKLIGLVFGALLCIAAGQNSLAIEMTWEYSVQVSATVQTSPATITLSWPQDQYLVPNTYTVYRKSLTDTAWGPGVTLPGTPTSYIDNNVTVGSAY